MTGKEPKKKTPKEEASLSKVRSMANASELEQESHSVASPPRGT